MITLKRASAILSLCVLAISLNSCSDLPGFEIAPPIEPDMPLSNLSANCYNGFGATDGDKIYFCAEGSINRLDINTLRHESIVSAKKPNSLMIDGHTLYFMEEDHKVLYSYDIKGRSKSKALEIEGLCLWIEASGGKATYLEKSESGYDLKQHDFNGGTTELLLGENISIDHAALTGDIYYLTIGSKLYSMEKGGAMSSIYDGSLSWLQAYNGKAFFIEAQESVASINNLAHGYQSDFISASEVSSLYIIGEGEYVYTVATDPESHKSAIFYRKGVTDSLLFEGEIEKTACFGSAILASYLVGGKTCYALIGVNGGYREFAN